jgi:hypothetical protein
LNYLNCFFRFLFEKLKYSTRLSESLFLFEVIISVPIENSLSLDTVDGGAQQTKRTHLARKGSFGSLWNQNVEKSLFSILNEL